jgi:hypothetical protein
MLVPRGANMTRRLAAIIVVLPIVFASTGRAQAPANRGRPDASWARLNGRVVDGVTGQPAADVPVLLQCSWLNGEWGQLRGTTDTNGQFTIGTPAGQCWLAFNVRGNLEVTGPGVRLFEFGPGETVETVRTLDATATVRPLEGRLLDDRGEPISGVRVILRSSTNRAGTRQWTSRAPVQSDAKGSFRFPAVWAGTWEVVVPALGLSRQVEVPRSTAASTSSAPIAILGSRLPTYRLSGRVETPSGSSRRLGVYLDRADSASSSPLTIAETASDDSGGFAFPDVPAGSYRLRVDTSATSPPGPGRGPFEIVWGVTPVVLTADVSGVVITARTGPELHAEVRLDDQPLAPGQSALLLLDAADGRFVPTIRTVDGFLITHGLVPGRYRVRFTGIPSGYRIKSVTVGGRDVTAEGFDLRDGPIDSMIITLTTQLTEVKGVVRDAQDRPDGEAAVLAFPTDRRLWTNTGQAPAFIGNGHVSQKGNYSVRGLPAGEYFVVATFSDPLLMTDAETLERLAPLAERVRLADGQTVTVNLRTKN